MNEATTLNDRSWPFSPGDSRSTPQRQAHRISCALFGHAADNRRFATEGPSKSCACGVAILAEDGTSTRTRHNLPCFFGSHSYARVGQRNGHNEYLCEDCGHPLLFEADRDPYASAGAFTKRVRYWCNLFGHESHVVTRRAGFTEYACHCGHTFLREASNLRRVTHPPICTFAGHFVRFVEHRFGHAEHVCRNCGHTFGFSRSAATKAA